jgi:SPP1 family predicted phage head-tail adaptor
MIGAGGLTETIEIQRVASTADGAGGFARAWTKVRTVRASVLPIGTGAEQMIAEGLQPVQAYKIVCRHLVGIGIEHRVLWQGQALNIRSAVDPNNRRRWTQIIADAGRVAA